MSCQPCTQVLHCFYEDQWELIITKRARVLGQHVTRNTLDINELLLICTKTMEHLDTRLISYSDHIISLFPSLTNNFLDVE